MFSKINVKHIPSETTSHSNGTRRMLVKKSDTSSKYLEAMTYGVLPTKQKWEMHERDNTIEICIVVKGNGVVRDSNGNAEHFEVGDRFIFPSNTKHEIENTSSEEAEFYFIRLQDQ